MLAQNFKTPADLQIDPRAFEALLTVLRMLERGELLHHTEGGQFDLATWHCGTVGCIGGWADQIAGSCLIATNNRGKNEQLSELVNPRAISHGDYSRVTPAQAAIALRNYLTFGEPRWAEAMAE